MLQEFRATFLWAYREDKKRLFAIFGAIAIIFFTLVLLGFWAAVNQ